MTDRSAKLPNYGTYLEPNTTILNIAHIGTDTEQHARFILAKILWQNKNL